jgi:hypothetical protein
MVQNFCNGHIHIDVMEQYLYILSNAYFLRKSPKTDFRHRNWVFHSFLVKKLKYFENQRSQTSCVYHNVIILVNFYPLSSS